MEVFACGAKDVEVDLTKFVQAVIGQNTVPMCHQCSPISHPPSEMLLLLSEEFHDLGKRSYTSCKPQSGRVYIGGEFRGWVSLGGEFRG